MKPRPPLRYFGGKWMLAPWIIAHLPPHRCYVEPFGGGASVLLRKQRSYAEVYNDLEGEVCNVFEVLRNEESAQRLRDLIHLTPFAREEFEASYEPAADQVEAARRTIVRSLMGFGSNAINTEGAATGFRNNSSRSGTTPAHDWANWPTAVPWYIERLRGVVIESRDALEIIPQHDTPYTLFYLDPPYVHSTRPRDGRCRYRHEMTDEEHEALAALLREVAGMVVISGYPCQLYDDVLFADWQRYERPALADGAKKRTEVLWMNAAASAHHSKQESITLPAPTFPGGNSDH